jgi:fluoroacetyl-CoA thioesterase
MRDIRPGLTGEFKLVARPEHLASKFKDDMLPQVFATPYLILAMENAALNAIRPFLDPDESAVGTVINIQHLAATPVGHEVRGFAEVTKVDGRRIEFNVAAFDEIEEIGRGTHERIVIDLPRFNERLSRKRKP